MGMTIMGIAMPDAFIVRALVAGCGIALVAGPLGCVVVWRRMAYFGDTLSHAALMGVTLGFLLGIAPIVGVIATGVVIGLSLVALQRQRSVPTDTLLGILSHSALAAGLIVASFLDRVRIDLMGYLFGDILAVSRADIVWVYAIGAAILLGLAVIWRGLIALTVDEDTAVAEGISSLRVRLAFTVLVALTVALAMKAVGILLVTALLIIPAAAARSISRGPEAMAATAAGVGCAAVIGGIMASLAWDVPSGPAVVVAAAAVFLLSLASSKVLAAGVR
jgi:zinc transport system permease protein